MSGFVLPYGSATPRIAPDAFVAATAVITGDVEIGPQASIWFGCVLRGDLNRIRVGARTNIQDGCVLHADPGYPAIVGDDCVVGHNAIVHGCEIENGCLVGMGAIILNGARIGEGSIVAAGALVPEGKEFPPGSLIVGIPAKRAKDVSEEQTEDIARGVRTYVERAAAHRESLQRNA